MKIFSTPLLPDSDTNALDGRSEDYGLMLIRQKEAEDLNQIKELIEDAPMYSPSETSLRIIMDYAREKLQK